MGLLSGLVVGSLLQPLEIIKMGIIIGPANSQQLSAKLNQTTNFVESVSLVTRHLYQTEGIKGFWRGLFPCLIRNGGGSSVYFSTLKFLENKTKDIEFTKVFNFVNSALARIASTIIINPVAVVGSRLEIPGFNEYRSLSHGFVKMYRSEGYRSFFRGIVPTCLKDGPFAGLYLLIYRPTK